jgi:hypothetical protein
MENTSYAKLGAKADADIAELMEKLLASQAKREVLLGELKEAQQKISELEDAIRIMKAVS